MWLLTGLGIIEELGKWPRGVWKDSKEESINFLTLGHESSNVEEFVREFSGQSLVQDLVDHRVLQAHDLAKLIQAVASKAIRYSTKLSFPRLILASIQDPTTSTEKRYIDL